MYQGSTFAGLLAHNAEKHPDSVAVRLGNRTLTHADLDRLSSRLAAGLRALGVKPGDRVATALPRLPENIIAFFAVNKVGAVIVPIHMGLKARELLPIFKEAEISCAMVTPKIFSALAPIRKELPALETVILLSYESISESHSFQELLEKSDADGQAHQFEENATAVILYTPGTLAGTRGAMQTQEGMLHSARGLVKALELSADDKSVGILDLNQMYGISTVMLTSLVAGSEIILIQRFVARDVLEACRDRGGTLLWGVPLAFMLLCLEVTETTYPTPDTLRLCISGGAHLPSEVGRRFEEIFGRKLLQVYGLVEAATVAITPPDDIRVGSVGLPLEGVTVKILDDDKELLDAGSVGDVVIQGPTVMKGYWRQEELTYGVLYDRGLYTGDVGRFDKDGHLYLVDRSKNIIISSDYKVYPSELEKALRTHPKIADAGVVGVKDVYMGEVPKAFVALKPGETADRDEIIEWCKANLADYSVPKYVKIVDEIPHDKAGSVLHDKLRNL